MKQAVPVAMRLGRVDGMAQHLQSLRSRTIEEFLPQGGRILEVGPGEGAFDRKGCAWVALNITPRASPTVLGDGQALPFRAASFDAAIALEVIEHVRYPYRLLREVRRVLRPGGRFLLSTPNVATPVNRVALGLLGRFPDDEGLHDGYDVGHIHFFTRRSFRRGVEAEGFEILAERPLLLQIFPRTYVYDSFLERRLPAFAKELVLELRPRDR